MDGQAELTWMAWLNNKTVLTLMEPVKKTSLMPVLTRPDLE